MIKMTLFITPVAKQRARIGKWGAYTPRKTAQFERVVREMARILMAGKKPLTSPLKLTVRFYFKPPRNLVRTYPCRGDTSNFLKALEDACNGAIWKDDIQIVEVNARKSYDMTGGAPRVELEVEELRDSF